MQQQGGNRGTEDDQEGSREPCRVPCVSCRELWAQCVCRSQCGVQFESVCFGAGCWKVGCDDIFCPVLRCARLARRLPHSIQHRPQAHLGFISSATIRGAPASTIFAHQVLRHLRSTAQGRPTRSSLWARSRMVTGGEKLGSGFSAAPSNMRCQRSKPRCPGMRCLQGPAGRRRAGARLPPLPPLPGPPPGLPSQPLAAGAAAEMLPQQRRQGAQRFNSRRSSQHRSTWRCRTQQSSWALPSIR